MKGCTIVDSVHLVTKSMNKRDLPKIPKRDQGFTRDDHPNKRYDVLFRHDGCTMVLFRGLVRCQADSRIQCLKKIYSDWRGDLFKVRSNLRQIRNASKPKK